MGGAWTLGRRPALDGVRGLAIGLVLASHLSLPGLTGAGAVGVAVFFTLSGFLISDVLLTQRQMTGSIDLRAFYVRRVRRLAPAVLASSLVVTLVGVWLDDWWIEWPDLLASLLYAGNWVEASPASDLGALGGTWSLAVEEQFYLVWPLVLAATAKCGRAALTVLAIVGAISSLVSRAFLIAGGAPSDRVYYGTDTVLFALLLGAALVMVMRGSTPGSRRTMLAATAVLLLLSISFWNALVAAYLALPLVSVATCVLLYASTHGPGMPFLESRWLVWLGQRSYGLYLWHCPLAWALRVHLGWSWPWLVAVVLPTSLVLAELSYRWIEQPWLVKGTSPKRDPWRASLGRLGMARAQAPRGQLNETLPKDHALKQTGTSG